MASEVEELGTIDWILVEFTGKEMSGELVPPLLDLVDRRLIRILDVLILLKDADGAVDVLAVEDLDPELVGDLGPLAGASSGLLADEDAALAAEALTPDSFAALLVYENLWSAPFSAAVRRAGGQLVDSGRIPVQAILARLDALDATDA
jgi:hypothetical protein